MTVERLGLARLGSIVAPFDGTGVDGADGSGISLAIEDPDGRVLATAGAPGNRGTAIEVDRPIEAGGRAIGRVVGRGTTDRALLEAVVSSVAAGLTALAELSNETISRSDAAAATAVRLEAELALGRRIQRSLIRSSRRRSRAMRSPAITRRRARSAATSSTCSGSGAGAGRVAICIADVTGKGVAAALLMAFTRPLLRAAVDHLRTPAAALEQTNRILVDERRSALFITALCATVEQRRGIVRLANAGHEPPLLVPADAGPISWLEGNAPLLGAFARLDLVEQVIQLAPGDLILFYTDGVTDAQAPSGLRFGDDRLIEALESARGGTANDAVEAVCDAYHRFQADQPNADDVAIVALRRAPRRRSLGGHAPLGRSVVAAPSRRPTSSSGPGQPRWAR